MKVAIIMHVPASLSGGGFYALRTQSELLSLYGFEIHIYEPYSNHHPPIRGNVIYHDYKSCLLDFLEKIVKPGIFPLLLNVNFEESYDFVYTFSPFYLSLMLFNRRYFRKTRKVIISTKDLLFPEKISKRILRYIDIVIYRILRLENLYLYNENSIENLLFKNLRVTTYEVPPLVDKNTFSYRFKKNENFTVLFLGSVEKRKGADMLFSILKKFENSSVNFKIAGKISDDYIEAAKSLKCENIIFLGSVGEDEKDYLLFNSDLGLMLSLEESYSIVTREMLLHGLPVITTWKPATDIFGYYGITYLSNPANIYDKILAYEIEYSNSYQNYQELRKGILFIYNEKFNKFDLEKKFLSIFNI